MKQDLRGQQFGYLTVLEEAERRGSRRYWRCRCRCGTEKLVEESHLKNGHTKSCGCYRKEVQKRRWIDITGERYGRLVALRMVEGGEGRPERWECQCDCGNLCVCYKDNLRAGVSRSCGCLQAEQRKENMKKAIHFVDGTCVEQIAKRGLSASNTSGHRGVYRRKNGRWRASIGFQGKNYSLGSFATYGEAVEARLAAEKRMYEPFLDAYRRKNFPSPTLTEKDGSDILEEGEI